MSAVFELFILNFFRHHATGFAAARENMRWDVAEGGSGDRSLIPIMRTDVALRSQDRVLVMDAKFYADPYVRSLGGRKFISGHLYQLYAYLRHAGRGALAKPVAGALVYASPHGRSIQRYRIDSHEVTVATIDLSQAWPAIHADLVALLSCDDDKVSEGAGELVVA